MGLWHPDRHSMGETLQYKLDALHVLQLLLEQRYMLLMQEIRDVLLQPKEKQKICQQITSQICQMKKEEYKEPMDL
jgi:hypothetical protein